MSLRDELTGLYNRRGFLEHAQTALRTVTRMRLSACVFFVDLNGMKRINDTFGHEAGDRAIAAAGRVLTSVFRESDVVARLGGDEFAVFAAECSQDDVAKVHERVRLAAEAANGASGEPFAVTMSVGASCFAPGSRADLTLLLEDADRAMYDHKRRSRS
jgi:diguanylate cyclase (GGDEF)-like protein